MSQNLRYEKIGNSYELWREQWRGERAFISDYPNLLEEVQKYTWTYSNGYLRCSKLSISLHQFVLEFLYGKENLSRLLSDDCIIEHLDNNGLNCCYDNLHILSADYNKAKAFTIDKAKNPEIPSFILDAFYSHERKYYQLQVTFNDNLFYLIDKKTEECVAVEAFYLQYENFADLFLDWLYLINSKGIDIQPEKFHGNKMIVVPRPKVELKPEEKDAAIIQRGDKFYVRLDTSGGPRTAFMSKTTFRETE